jgi:hypothetical protein
VHCTAPSGAFRVAVYGEEQHGGQKHEFVARGMVLVGVEKAEQPPRQSAAPEEPKMKPEEMHAEMARLFAELPSRATPDLLAGPEALITLHATGEGGGDWWVRMKDGKCESGEGQAKQPNLAISGAIEDMLAVTHQKMDPSLLWMSGRLTVTGDFSLLNRLAALAGLSTPM